MYVKDLSTAQKRELDGLVSHILLEEHDVAAGHMIFIPSNTEHGIVNTGDEVLTYVSAATPAFPVTELYDAGQISLSP